MVIGMLMLVITGIIVFFVSSVTLYLSDRFKKRRLLKASIAGFLAVLGLLAGYYLDILGAAQNKPKVEVKTSIKQGELSITVVGDKPSLDKATISFHLPFHITNVERLGSSKSEIYVEGNQIPDYLTNCLEIRIEDIAPKQPIVFNTFLKPSAAPNIGFIDRNVYAVEYVWRYKGETHYATEWRSLNDDSLIDPPYAQLSAIRIVGDQKKGTLWFNIKILRPSKANDRADVVWLKKNDWQPPLMQQADKNTYQAPYEPLPRKQY